MFATQVLPDTCHEDKSEEENDSEVVGILSIGDDHRYEIKKGETKIGRDPAICTVVVDNFTVSKLHAVIESDGRDDTFIYDIGSTNQTKLGKKCLKPHCRYKLDDNSFITLGNVVAKFTLPFEVINNCLKTDTITPPSSGEKNATSDGFDDDIFDAPTQVYPQPSTSKHIPAFEEVPVFKTPIALPSAKEVKESPETSESCFDEVTQCQLYSQEQQIGSDPNLESSNIFNLSTQCPISPTNKDDSSKSKDIPEEGNKEDLDKMKSLLNDGQDDVLCTFMSLHSPNVESLMKKIEIKTEVVTEDVTSEKDGGPSPEKNKIEAMDDKSFEFQNSSQQQAREDNNEDDAQPEVEEDFICTQKFKEVKSEPVVQEAEKSDESYLEITLDSSIPDDENLILTQKFILEQCQEITASFQPADILKTREEMNSEFLELTQRNNEDDFIETQVYESPKSVVANAANTQSHSDDDSQDFIATQELRLPLGESTPKTLSVTSSPRNCEDFISTQVFQIKNETPKREPVPDSSGDETESDLEIILDEGDPLKDIAEINKPKVNVSIEKKIMEREENQDSNSSYVFQIHDSDSDATDCGDLEELIPIKKEPVENEVRFEDTQVLTLTPPKNFEERTNDANNDWMIGRESPRFEINDADKDFWNVDEPNTQEMDTSLNRILNPKPAQEKTTEEDYETPTKRREIEVGTCVSKPVDSPLKRIRDNKNAVEVPTKKAKTFTENTFTDRLLRSSEKQFSKLCQSHDIAQIQPNRTRSSRQAMEDKPSGGICTNELETSSRSNRKGEKADRRTGRKRTAANHPKENTMVLRSSRNSVGGWFDPPRNILGPRGRNSRNRDDHIRNPCVKVVFTGFDCESLEKIIAELGGKKMNDLSLGDVVVADKVRRTVKFLCAMGLSLPIASPEWLLASRKAGRFLNPWDFILIDEESEEKWDFQLRNSLERSKKAKLLEGYSVFATESTKPPVKDLLAIVECCGGIPIRERPETWPKKSIVVSCPEDSESWPAAKLRHVKVVHYEFILSGVLKQKIDFKTYDLR